MAIPGLFLHVTLVLQQGAFAPMTLLSIFTTTPHLPSITTDSPPREALLPVTRTGIVMDFSCCTIDQLLCMLTPLPGGYDRCLSHSLPGHRRPSPLLWRIGTIDGISMAAQCSLTLRPA
ncbi:hypothetical protein ACAG23_02125 [Escherichia coli]